MIEGIIPGINNLGAVRQTVSERTGSLASDEVFKDPLNQANNCMAGRGSDWNLSLFPE